MDDARPLVSPRLDESPTDEGLDPVLLDAFIARWSAASGGERSNYQLFLTELCTLLGLPQPDPAREETQDNAYCFERRVVFQHGDGTQSQGFIDLYRRTCYVLECKQTGLELDSGVWDKAMLRAHGQAVQYARALPAAEGRPPFVVVVDVGRSIELYSEFSRSGGAYIPYPDPRSHRIRLADLRRPEIRARLRALWLDPASLDPSRQAARVTREIAARLARLAISLESAGHPPVVTAAFLIRCLFTLFAEVLDTLESLGQRQLLMAMEGVSVDPHQLLGLELNPRAAAIAETVLWIGYLQWHFRTHGNLHPPEPVIRDFRNIQCRDAVLDYDRVEWVTDASGRPVSRWDGRTFKTHPVTGEQVPDETARVLVER